MEFRLLKYFLAVVTEKNISRAAKRLHVSQPTLSKQLKDLENELGVTLFVRGNREIELTEEGVYLFNKAKEIMSLVDQTVTNLQDEVIAGEVYIGGGETKAMSIISEASKEFLNDYPNVKIRLYSADADDVKNKLNCGLLDFGLVIGITDKQKYELLPLPFEDKWGLMVHHDHELAKNKVLTALDLRDVPLFISQQSLVGNQFSDWLGRNLEHYHFVGTYNLLYNVSLMVEAGVGSALCLDGIINTEGKNIKFIPLEPPLTASLHLIWKKNQTHSRAALRFLEKLQTIIERKTKS